MFLKTWLIVLIYYIYIKQWCHTNKKPVTGIEFL